MISSRIKQEDNLDDLFIYLLIHSTHMYFTLIILGGTKNYNIGLTCLEST